MSDTKEVDANDRTQQNQEPKDPNEQQVKLDSKQQQKQDCPIVLSVLNSDVFGHVASFNTIGELLVFSKVNDSFQEAIVNLEYKCKECGDRLFQVTTTKKTATTENGEEQEQAFFGGGRTVPPCECSQCKDKVCSHCVSPCDKCGKKYCNDCNFKCGDCRIKLCFDCAFPFGECGFAYWHFCSNCNISHCSQCNSEPDIEESRIFSCIDCEKEFCLQCMDLRICSSCEEHMCDDCGYVCSCGDHFLCEECMEGVG